MVLLFLIEVCDPNNACKNFGGRFFCNVSGREKQLVLIVEYLESTGGRVGIYRDDDSLRYTASGKQVAAIFLR